MMTTPWSVIVTSAIVVSLELAFELADKKSMGWTQRRFSLGQCRGRGTSHVPKRIAIFRPPYDAGKGIRGT